MDRRHCQIRVTLINFNTLEGLVMLTKQEKFKAGKYVVPAPPVSTQYWNVNDWINYIDIYGRWLE